MSELIYMMILLIFNSFVIFGWYKCTYYELNEFGYVIEDSKMVFWRLNYFCSKYISEWWMKPLFTCPICMASVHSTYVYWIFMPQTFDSLIIYPVYVLALAGFNSYLNNKI